MMICIFRIFSCQISLELSLCVSRGVVTPAVYLANLMVVLIVFPFILTRSSNTKSLYGKSVYEELAWKICFLIYHTVIEHRAGTREDISCWHWWLFWSENKHIWPRFYCIFIVFTFRYYPRSSGHLLHPFHLFILRRKARESLGECEYAECFCIFQGLFSGFMFILWWVVFTRCSINRAGGSICLSELLGT